MYLNPKMSRHYEAFGTCVTGSLTKFGLLCTLLLLFLFFQVAQGAMEAKKDAHTWDFKSLMFEKTTTTVDHDARSAKKAADVLQLFFIPGYFEGLIEVAPR